jgi:hypothetical protein
MNSSERKLELDALRLEGRPFHRGGVQFRRCLLAMKFKPEQGWIASPDRPFIPHGLAIWNTPPGSVVACALIASNLQITCSWGPVPARFFAFGDSYEQIAKKLDEGCEPPTWCDWDPIQPGANVRLDIRNAEDIELGPPAEVVFWGICSVY